MESISRYIKDEEYYLLDGHFCLLNSDEKVTEIPFDTFKSLVLKVRIVLVDEESEAVKRKIDRDTKRIEARCEIANATS